MFNHILVPLDGSVLAESVLPHVIALSRTIYAEVTLLHVLEHHSNGGHTVPVDPLDWHVSKAEAEVYLEKVATRLRDGGLRANHVVIEGKAAEGIIEYAHSHAVDLIIICSHGESGLTGWNISSVVQKIILRVYLSIMIVRAYRSVPEDLDGLVYNRLLLPLDGSQRAECVLPLATALARKFDAHLVPVLVVARPEMPHWAPPVPEDTELADAITERNRAEAARYLDQLQPRLDGGVEPRLLLGTDVSTTLQDFVEKENIDLVLMSAHGNSIEARWPYGSKAMNFIIYGTTPLLIVQDLPESAIGQTQAEVAAEATGAR
ncbi:MAG: universal stress protein [Chloroflexi bacterium]|nr:universal stress protein [Chloroflexota bacterium]